MAAAANFPGDVSVSGALSVNGALTAGSISGATRSSLAQEDLAVYPLPTFGFRIWDAFQTNLTTSSSDDLGIGTGAFATGLPYITTGDVKVATTTRYARTMFTLPPNYVAGETIQVRL